MAIISCYLRGRSYSSFIPVRSLTPLLSWQVTLLRKGGLYRIEVEYTGRRMCNHSRQLLVYLMSPLAASATNAIPRRHPPYMAVLQHVMGLSSETSSEKQDDNKLLRVISRRISRCSSFLRPQCNV